MIIFETPEALANAVAPWAKFYSHSSAAATIVTFLHIAPLVVGGGLAIALDRAALRVPHDVPGERERHPAELGSVHSVVIGALVVTFVSGLLLLAADLDTFLPSWVFWVKLALVAAFLVNGAVMRGLERRLSQPGDAREDQWHRLRGTAMTSLVLWLAITFAGVMLVNAS